MDVSKIINLRTTLLGCEANLDAVIAGGEGGIGVDGEGTHAILLPRALP